MDRKTHSGPRWPIALALVLLGALFVATTVAVIRHRGDQAVAAAPATDGAPATSEPHFDAPRVLPPQHYDYEVGDRRRPGVPLRPMDIEIFQRIERVDVPREQLHDLFPDRPYRVQLVGSVAQRWFTAVLIDLDRDGVLDERWQLRENEVTRRTLVKGEPEGGTPYALRAGRWLPF